MKPAARILLFLALAACLLVGYFRQQGTKGAATVSSPSNNLQALSVDTASVPAPDAPLMPEDSEEEPEKVEAFESIWASELRKLRELAALAPDAAFAQVAQLPDKHERKIAAVAVCEVVAEKDPAKAMAAAWSFELGRFSHEPAEDLILERLAKQWAEADVANALLWASALPVDEESRRDRVIKGIASALAQHSPTTAASLVAENISSESGVQLDAVVDVLRQWAARDYAGALAWTALFPEGPIRDRGIEELVKVDAGEVPAGR